MGHTRWLTAAFDRCSFIDRLCRLHCTHAAELNSDVDPKDLINDVDNKHRDVQRGIQADMQTYVVIIAWIIVGIFEIDEQVSCSKPAKKPLYDGIGREMITDGGRLIRRYIG